jgi:integrase
MAVYKRNDVWYYAFCIRGARYRKAVPEARTKYQALQAETKALEDAGIPHIPFHCAGRHTFGTRAIDNGAPIRAVKEVMGHMDIRTTMRYVHATEEGKRRAVELAARPRVKSPFATNLPQEGESPI